MRITTNGETPGGIAWSREQDAFFWIDAIPCRAVQVEPAPPLDTLTENQARWTIGITALQDLVVGGGAAAVVPGSDRMHARFMRDGEALLIPGSSIKGAVRAVVEALSPSCLDPQRCDGARCAACTLFGSIGRSGHMGRVAISEVRLADATTTVCEVAQRTTPTNDVPPGRKFYTAHAATRLPAGSEKVETVRAGAGGSFTIDLRNLRDWELGLLALSLGIIPTCTFNLKCGGCKNRGWGLVRFNWVSGEHAEGADWALRRRRETQPADLERWAGAYQRLAEEWGVMEDVLEVLRCFRREYGNGA